MGNFIAIVLAAGHARRFGSNKMAALLHGTPLLWRAIQAARKAPVSKVLVVTRPQTDIGVWAKTPPVRSIELESEALSESLKYGIESAGQVDGAFIFLGDMPAVPHDIATRLATQLGSNYAVLPQYNGRSGHPVLLSKQAFPDILRLQGDEGAGKLLRARSDIAYVDCPDAGIHFDIDYQADLSAPKNFTP